MTRAAQHTGATVLVDGSNVARCAAWRARHERTLTDDELRERLAGAVGSWSAASGDVAAVILVFDGTGPWRAGRTDRGAGLTVEGSGAQSGDAIVEAHAARLASLGARFWIVSDDRQLRAAAGVHAERCLSSSMLIELCVRDDGATAHDRSDAHKAPARGLADRLDDRTLAALERLRRGEA